MLRFRRAVERRADVVLGGCLAGVALVGGVSALVGVLDGDLDVGEGVLALIVGAWLFTLGVGIILER